MALASREQQDRLVSEFVRYCEIESPSRRERPMADAITADLRALGLDVVEDDSGAETGSDSGNLLARIDGPEGARTILLCAHLDTVPLDAPVAVERDDDGIFRNRNAAILGADNKAAVAVIMETARHLVATGSPVAVELLFTTTEELALRGASAFDQSVLNAEFGFVFDHATPIGEVIVAAPTYYQLDVTFHGKAAHAGMRPEDGHNAIAAAAAGLSALEFGRLDAQTTANVGLIKGGNQGNVVPDRCDVLLETRSLDHDRAHTDRAEDGRRADRRRAATTSATPRSICRSCSAATSSRRPRRRSRPRPARSSRPGSSRSTSTPAAAATPTRSSSTASRA